jgi:hypothetical protein
MADIEQHDNIQVFVGVEVGKGTHHAVALDRTGKRRPQGEAQGMYAFAAID